MKGHGGADDDEGNRDGEHGQAEYSFILAHAEEHGGIAIGPDNVINRRPGFFKEKSGNQEVDDEFQCHQGKTSDGVGCPVNWLGKYFYEVHGLSPVSCPVLELRWLLYAMFMQWFNGFVRGY